MIERTVKVNIRKRGCLPPVPATSIKYRRCLSESPEAFEG